MTVVTRSVVRSVHVYVCVRTCVHVCLCLTGSVVLSRLINIVIQTHPKGGEDNTRNGTLCGYWDPKHK